MTRADWEWAGKAAAVFLVLLLIWMWDGAREDAADRSGRHTGATIDCYLSPQDC